MLALGVDTSNYATSLAVVDETRREVVCALKRFLPVKEGALGLRQSDAVFHHTAALPQLLAELKTQADIQKCSAVGVSQKPRGAEDSYMPCFLAGVSFAEALAAGLGVAPVYTTHQQGHLAAALLGAGLWDEKDAPMLFVHLSGGTTELLLCQGTKVTALLGGSADLHAGQLVDRLGVQLGYAFPAGEAVSTLAQEYTGPLSPKISVNGMQCHLSGLQNQFEAMLAAGESPAKVARYCLLALAHSLGAMLQNALTLHPGLPILCAGGVGGSPVIREYLQNQFEHVYFAPPRLSQDNAVGVAMIAATGG